MAPKVESRTQTVDLGQPLRGATFGQALSRFWRKYAVFKGRASRSEFWFAALFLGLALVVFNVVAALTTPLVMVGFVLLWFAGTVPGIAVTVRRLHDTGKSGWHYVLFLVPILGTVLMIVMCTAAENPGGDRFNV